MRDESTTNPLDSQISAFLDGELPTGEAEFLIRRLERDGQLQQQFSRYALIGEVMRTPAGAGTLLAAKDFASRVQQAIAAEAPAAPVVAEVKRGGIVASRWFKPAAGLSIAAGVAALAVGILNVQEPAQVATVAATSMTAPEAAEGSAIEASYVVPEITVTGPLLPAARLTNYVMAHSEYSSPLGRRNVLSGMLADETTMPADEIVPTGFVPSDEPARLEQP